MYFAAFCKDSNNEISKYLLSKGGKEIDFKQGEEDWNTFGWLDELNEKYKNEFPEGTPLVCACEKGRVEDVEGMIRGARAAGMDVTAMVSELGTISNGWSFTPLMAAAYYEHSTIIEILLQCNADTATTDNNGWNEPTQHEMISQNDPNRQNRIPAGYGADHQNNRMGGKAPLAPGVDTTARGEQATMGRNKMEILDEGFILTGTTSPAIETVFRLQPLQKKRRVLERLHVGHYRFEHTDVMYRRTTVKMLSAMFPKLLINPNPFGTLGPSTSDPGRKFRNNIRPNSWALRK